MGIIIAIIILYLVFKIFNGQESNSSSEDSTSESASASEPIEIDPAILSQALQTAGASNYLQWANQGENYSRWLANSGKTNLQMGLTTRYTVATDTEFLTFEDRLKREIVLVGREKRS